MHARLRNRNKRDGLPTGLPLAGITVVSVEQAIAAPLATRHLADLGARVIKVERPDGGDFARTYDHRTRGLSSQFVWVNRSKESITLNLKNAEGKEVLRRLLTKADIFVENLSPSALKRLGLSIDALRHSFPDLIVCAISGYGTGGPYEQKKAYDLLVQAEAGLLSLTGTPAEPVRCGISVADIAAGMYAFSNILCSLMYREKTGHACHIDVSLMESLCEWMGSALYYSFENASPPERAGAFHSTIFPYGPFVAGDGKEVLLAVQNEREWQGFCQIVIECPTLQSDPRFSSNLARSQHRRELAKIIDGAFSGLTREEVLQRLELAKIANAQVNGMSDVWNHPQLKARSRWRQVATPAGPIPALLPPGKIDCFEPRMGAIPALGENTDSLLLECGFSKADIAHLRRVGAV